MKYFVYKEDIHTDMILAPALVVQVYMASDVEELKKELEDVKAKLKIFTHKRYCVQYRPVDFKKETKYYNPVGKFECFVMNKAEALEKYETEGPGKEQGKYVITRVIKVFDVFN